MFVKNVLLLSISKQKPTQNDHLPLEYFVDIIFTCPHIHIHIEFTCPLSPAFKWTILKGFHSQMLYDVWVLFFFYRHIFLIHCLMPFTLILFKCFLQYIAWNFQHTPSLPYSRSTDYWFKIPNYYHSHPINTNSGHLFTVKYHWVWFTHLTYQTCLSGLGSLNCVSGFILITLSFCLFLITMPGVLGLFAIHL